MSTACSCCSRSMQWHATLFGIMDNTPDIPCARFKGLLMQHVERRANKVRLLCSQKPLAPVLKFEIVKFHQVQQEYHTLRWASARGSMYLYVRAASAGAVHMVFRNSCCSSAMRRASSASRSASFPCRALPAQEHDSPLRQQNQSRVCTYQ